VFKSQFCNVLFTKYLEKSGKKEIILASKSLENHSQIFCTNPVARSSVHSTVCLFARRFSVPRTLGHIGNGFTVKSPNQQYQSTEGR